MSKKMAAGDLDASRQSTEKNGKHDQRKELHLLSRGRESSPVDTGKAYGSSSLKMGQTRPKNLKDAGQEGDSTQSWREGEIADPKGGQSANSQGRYLLQFLKEPLWRSSRGDADPQIGFLQPLEKKNGQPGKKKKKGTESKTSKLAKC